MFSLIAMPLKAEINNQNLAVLVNVNDPESVEIAEYYKKVRLIPDSNLIYLKFKAGVDKLTATEFRKIEIQLNESVAENIQAYVLAWRRPWRVDCMSVTSAFSLGFNEEYCAKDCKYTKPVNYFNSQSRLPHTDFKIRPSMMLSAGSVGNVKKLIDRGVSADFTRPIGSAYLLRTSDKQRNVREVFYQSVQKGFNKTLIVEDIKADAIKHKMDVMFYFTGLSKVKWVNKNTYLPGAVADHLTSTGGQLFNGYQMSVLDWVDAGVTGTYGTVVEPCNFVKKFPNPYILILKYLSGETLLESYWKSVQMPGQGVYVGDPLAAPYKGCELLMNVKGDLQFFNSVPVNFVERKSRNCN